MKDLEADQVLIEEKNIDEFMIELASDSPAPGGGAAGGMNGAIGAALIGMVCRITINKSSADNLPEVISRTLPQADELRGKMLRSAYDDYVAFRDLIASYKMPKSNDEEVAVRKERIAATTRAATRVPLRCAAQAREIMELARGIAEAGAASVISDVGAAAVSAYSALRIAALNVNINTKHSKDEDFRNNAEQELAAAMDGAAELLEEISEIVHRRM